MSSGHRQTRVIDTFAALKQERSLAFWTSDVCFGNKQPLLFPIRVFTIQNLALGQVDTARLPGRFGDIRPPLLSTSDVLFVFSVVGALLFGLIYAWGSYWYHLTSKYSLWWGRGAVLQCRVGCCSDGCIIWML